MKNLFTFMLISFFLFFAIHPVVKGQSIGHAESADKAISPGKELNKGTNGLNLIRFSITSVPVAYNVTGGGSYCQGAGGIPVGLDNSEAGVTYTLYKDLVAQSPTVIGIGSAISFGNQLAGIYTVKGTNADGTTDMTGSAAITEIPAPTAFAGPDDFGTVGIPYLITGATASNYASLLWTKSGTGTLTNATTLNPSYTPNTTGFVTLTLTVTGNAPCGVATDAMQLFSLPPSTDPVTWKGTTSSNWGLFSNWEPAFVPASVTDVTIPASGVTNFPTITSAAACKNITIESGASLLDNSFLTISGTCTVKRAITANEWHLISSPVTSALSGMFTGKYLQTHNESTNLYTDITSTTQVLTPVKGYALWSSTGINASYTGPFNTGSKSISVTAGGQGWNLVGNPYPSSIDWDASTGWTKTNINNAIYLHVNASTWATYIAGAGVNGGSRYIAPGQGFFVRATAGGTLGMTNSVRIHHSTSFFKNAADEIISNFVRLQVSGNSYNDEAIIRIVPEATNGFDANWDAEKLFADEPTAPQIYSLGNNELAINALPVVQPVVVGMRVSTTGSYSITASEENGLTDVSLEDTKTNTFNKLSEGPYTFDFEAGENEHRFILHFGALGINDPLFASENIYTYIKTVYINLSELSSGSAFIYNLSGQLVTSASVSNGMNRIVLPASGIYVIKVITTARTIVKKVWIE